MYNKVILMGYVGAVPKCGHSSGGTQYASFSLATNEHTKDGKATTWHTLSCFGKVASVVEKYVKSGMPVLVEGKITYNEKEGKKYTNITVFSVTFLPKMSDIVGEASRSDTGSPEIDVPGWVEDIPF